MKTLKMSKMVLALGFGFLVSACGKAPDLSNLNVTSDDPVSEDTSVPTTATTIAQTTEAPVTEAPTASNPLTVLKFNYYAVTVCDAVRNWNRTTTEIRIDQSPPTTNIYGQPVPSANYYSFTASGVKLLKTADASVANAHPSAVLTKTMLPGPQTICKITITSGALASIQ